MFHFGRADDRAMDMWLTQDPCQRDLGGGHAALLRHICGAICHTEILFTEIQTFRKGIAVGSFGFAASAALAVSGKEATRHRAPGDQPDALLLAQRDHLTLLFTINEIVVVLHRYELRPAMV